MKRELIGTNVVKIERLSGGDTKWVGRFKLRAPARKTQWVVALATSMGRQGRRTKLNERRLEGIKIIQPNLWPTG